MRIYHLAVVGFSVAFVCLGIALLVVTAAQGGGAVGFLLGALFITLGAGRFTLERRRTR